MPNKNEWNKFLSRAAWAYRWRKYWTVIVGMLVCLAAILLMLCAGCTQPVTPAQAQAANEQTQDAIQALQAAEALPAGIERDHALQAAYALIRQTNELNHKLKIQAQQAAEEAEFWGATGKAAGIGGTILTLAGIGFGQYLKLKAQAVAAEAQQTAEEQRKLSAVFAANIEALRAGMTPQQWETMVGTLKAQQQPVTHLVTDARNAATSIPGIMAIVAQVAQTLANPKPTQPTNSPAIPAVTQGT